MPMLYEVLKAFHGARLVAVSLTLVGAVVTAGWAQEELADSEEPPNAVSIFLGATVEPANRGSGASVSLGASYNRRLTELFSLGAFAEGSFGETEREALLGLSAFVHVYADLVFVVAPIFEFSQRRGTGETESKLGLRAGALYEFPVGRRYILAPEAYLDFVDGDVMLVVGASFALMF